MKRYRVRLDPEYRWATVQVNAREFTKSPVVLQEAELTEEIANSPLLVVEEMEDADLRTEDGSVDATDGARALAEEMGVELGSLVGTGAGGRVTKKDVEAELTRISGQSGSEDEDG